MKNRRVLTILMILVLTLSSSIMVYGNERLTIDSKLNDDNFYEISGTQELLQNGETKIVLPEGIEWTDVEHVSLVDIEANRIEAITYEIHVDSNNEAVLLIEPTRSLDEETSYEIRIFSAEKRFVYGTKVESYVDFGNYEVSFEQLPYEDGWKDVYFKKMKISANPDKGFSFPYFIYVPVDENGEYLDSTYSKHLIVEPNNTGAISSHDFAEKLIESDHDMYPNFALRIANTIGSPYLTPAFPRPDNLVYTHGLDDDTLFMTKALSDEIGIGNLVDIPGQLRAMTIDAKRQFESNGIILAEKYNLAGFSASADFTQRYSLIYPEDINTIVTGTSYPMLPISEYKGQVLRYPLGISDYKANFGRDFNLPSFNEIKQYWLIGENDHGTIVQSSDGFNKREVDIIQNIFNSDGIINWATNETIFEQVGSQIQFVMYKNMGHDSGAENMNQDVIKFFENNLNSDRFVEIEHHVNGWFGE